MHYPFATKTVVSLLGTGVTNGATVTANVDRQGYDSVSISLVLGTADNATNKPSVLKVSESDTTDATNFSDVTALVGGGTGGFTIPSADTTNPNMYRFNVDCRGRKRYLKLTCSPRTTQQAVMMADLYRAKESPATTTAKGVHLEVNA